MDKYLIDDEKKEKERKKLECIITKLNKAGHKTDHLINYIHCLTVKQYLKLNSSYFLPLSESSVYDPLGTITKTNYAYLYIPDYIGYYRESASRAEDISDRFSYIILNLIDKLYKKDPVGWIFDLRKNDGGIIHSFILGFSSILNYFTIHCKNKKGKVILDLVYQDEHLYYQYIGEKAKILGLLPPLNKIKIDNVSVLIDDDTASCGELLTYLLKKQYNAVIYGEPSYGLSTWMELYEIPGYDNLVDNMVLRYPELIFDFSDSDLKYVNTKKYKDTPVLSIAPDQNLIPYDKFGIF